MERCESLKSSLGLILLCLLLGACGLQSRPTPTAPTTLEPQANDWQQLGMVVNVDATKDAQTPSIALNSSGQPTVSLSEGLGNAANVYVKRWDGSSWQQLGNSLDVNLDKPAINPSIALDSLGNPTVSWEELAAVYTRIYVKQWNSTSWVLLPPANIGLGNSANPSLALDSVGNPIVSWQEFDGSSYNIYVGRWDDVNGWSILGGAALDINAYLPAFSPSLALDSAGNPVVSWQELDSSYTSQNVYVKRWNGNSWVQLGGALDVNVSQGAALPSLALDSSGNPTVSWVEFVNGSGTIQVKRWSGSSWVQLGGSLNINANQYADSPSLALDGTGNPTVSWTETTDTYTIYAKRWNGSSWVQLGGALDVNANQNAFAPSLAIDSAGNPNVSWQEYDGTSYKVYVKRYDLGDTWQDLGGALDVQVGQFAMNSSIARKSNDNPVVAWEEQDGTLKNVYVKEWTGGTWRPLGGALDRTLSNDASHPSIAMRSDNRPTVAFVEANDVYVKRWNGSRWINISNNALDSVPGSYAYTPSLALDTNNRPVVAYVENNDIFVKKANGVAASSSWTSPFGTAPLDINPSSEAEDPSLERVMHFRC